MDYSYLAPPKEANFIVHTDHYIKHNEREKGARKIFETVVYDHFELEKIKELKQEILTQKIVLPSDWKESDYLRIGYAGRFKMKEVIKKLQQFISWKGNKIYHVINSQTEKFLKEGVCYVFGRDKQYRPIVILNAHQIDLKKYDKDCIIQALSFMMGIIKQHMFVAGKVENWTFLLESHNQGVMGLPIKILQTIIDILSTNFSGCLEKMFILNPSTTLNFLWKTIKGFLDEETAEKINFLQSKEFPKLLSLIDPTQLEVKYGGKQPNQEKFWPPYNLDLKDGYTVVQVDKRNSQALDQSDKYPEGEDPYDKVDDNLNDFMKFQQQVYYSGSLSQNKNIENMDQKDEVEISAVKEEKQEVSPKPNVIDERKQPDEQVEEEKKPESDQQKGQQSNEIKESTDQAIFSDRSKVNQQPLLSSIDQNNNDKDVNSQVHKAVIDLDQNENNEIQKIDPVMNNSSCCKTGCEIF